LLASELFCKMDEDYEPPLAGTLSEQFSLASAVIPFILGTYPFMISRRQPEFGD
jgi:hypothetical protein